MALLRVSQSWREGWVYKNEDVSFDSPANIIKKKYLGMWKWPYVHVFSVLRVCGQVKDAGAE